MSWIILQVASLFVGQLEEGSPGKDDAHAGPHGEAHEAKSNSILQDLIRPLSKNILKEKIF